MRHGTGRTRLWPPDPNWIVGVLRPVPILAVAVVVLLAAVAGGVNAPRAQATITNVIATNEVGEPLDESITTLNDNENLWAYVTSPSGGLIRVVPAGCADSCDGAAWSEVPVPPFFAGLIPVAPAPLRPGYYKLVSIDPDGEVETESQRFRITVCEGDCDPAAKPDPTNAKRVFGSIVESIYKTCQLSKLLVLAKVAEEAKETYDLYVVNSGSAAVGMAIVKVAAGVSDMAFLAAKPSAVPYLPPAIGLSIWAMCTAVFGIDFPESPIPFVPIGPSKNVPGPLATMQRWRDDPPQPYETVDPASFIDFAKFDTSGFVDPDGSFRGAIAVDRVRGFLAAGTTAWERFQAAYDDGAAARSFQHAQSLAVAENFTQLRASVAAAAEELDALAGALQADGTVIESVSQDDIDGGGALMRRVRDSGFTAAEIASLHAQGLGDGEIAQLRGLIGGDAETVTTSSSFIADLREIATNLLAAGDALDEFATQAAFYAGRTNAPPQASFTATPTSGAPPLQVQFTDTSTSPDLDPIESVTWDFGDGATGEGASATHTYAVAGTYTVTETVSDYLDSSTATKQIVVGGSGGNRPPAAVADLLSTSKNTAGSVDVLANDSDPDGDSLSVASSTQPAHGSVSCAAAGLCTFTPALDYVGDDSFTYTVSDGHGGTAVGTVAVTVTATASNRPPAAANDVLSTDQDTPGTVDVLANDSDPDGDTLTVTSAAPAAGHGTVACTGAGACTYTPATGFKGSDSFQYAVSDGHGGTASATVAVTVVGPNEAPVAVDDTLVMLEDDFVLFNVLANDGDPDGDPLTLVDNTSGPDVFALCGGNGLCSILTAADFNGDASFTYKVGDGRGGQATGVVRVTVTPVPDPPRTQSDTATTTKGVPVTFDVLANDVEPDGDVFEVVGVSSEFGGTADCTSAGACTFRPDPPFEGRGEFRYTVRDATGLTSVGDANVTVSHKAGTPFAVPVAAPARGVAPLYTAFDGRGSHDDGRIVAWEWDFGDGDTASGSVVQHAYETPGSYTAVLTVTDDEGNKDSATVQGSAIAPGRIFVQDLFPLGAPYCGDEDEGTIVLRCPDFTYTPSVQMYQVPGTGPVQVTFDFILRGGGLPNEMGVFKVDDARGAIGGLLPGDPGYLAAAFGRATVVFPGDSLASTPDVTITRQGGDILVFFLVQTTLADLLDRNPGNSPNAFPDAFFSFDLLNPDDTDHVLSFRNAAAGVNQFMFEDLTYGGDGDWNDMVFTVVTGQGGLVPLPPLVVTKTADAAKSAAGSTNGYTITVANSGTVAASFASISDTLPAGFSYRGATTTGATTADPAVSGQTLRWTGPFVVEPGGKRSIHFGVTVASAAGIYSNEATADAGEMPVHPTGPTAPITVTAGPVNRAPVAVDGALGLDQDTAKEVMLEASDPDGNPLSYAIVSGPAHGSLSGSGAARTYTPAPGYSGPDAFTFKANDGLLDSNVATVSITVRHVNHAPVAGDQAVATDEGVAVEVTLGAADADGDALSFAIAAGPGHGSVGPVAGNKVTYTPAAGYSGPDSFTFRASDGQASSTVATVSITVRPSAPAPAAACALCILGPTPSANLVLSGSASVAGDGPIMLEGFGVTSGHASVMAPAIGFHGPPPIGPGWSPQPMALAQAVADPLAAIPSPSASGACRNVAANGRDSLTLSPGVYCTIAASGTSRLTLEPGLYVVTRGIALSGDSSLRGQGATLFVACAGFPAPCGGGSGAGIAMSGHTAVELSGMPSLPAVLFERSNAGSLTMSGSSTAAFDGAVYGRWVAATFSGSASLTAVGGPVVVARLTASGSAQIRVSLHP